MTLHGPSRSTSGRTLWGTSRGTSGESSPHFHLAARRGLIMCGLLLALLASACAATPGARPPVISPTASPTAISSVTPMSTPTTTPTATPTPTPAPTQTPTPAPSPTNTAVTGPLAEVITAGRPDTGVIALTFDLGVKGPGETPRVLDILHDSQVSSTFFPIGIWAENNPEILRRIISDGHELGNHTYDHPDLRGISDEEIAQQLERTETIIYTTTGQTSKPYMRPPFGAYDKRVLAILNRLGYSMVYWTLDSTDWREESTAASVVEWVVAKAKPGDIVVLHGHAVKTADALPGVIAGLKAKGYRLGTLSEVLGR